MTQKISCKYEGNEAEQVTNKRGSGMQGITCVCTQVAFPSLVSYSLERVIKITSYKCGKWLMQYINDFLFTFTLLNSYISICVYRFTHGQMHTHVHKHLAQDIKHFQKSRKLPIPCENISKVMATTISITIDQFYVLLYFISMIL